jgi:hypothetical protein
VFRTYIETTKSKELFHNKTKQSETKIPKYALFQTVWVGLLFFRFNRNIETLCFGIKAKQPKQTVPKQTEKNRKNPKFSDKIVKYAPYKNCFGWSSVCYGSIETSKLSFSV